MRGARRTFHFSLFRRRDVTRDVDEEIAFHLAMREQRLRAEGMPAADASRIAASRFGNVEGIRAECLREGHTLALTERIMQWIDEARRDAQLAVRSLLHARGFTAAVILTLALGIGANATIFAVTNAIVLEPVSGVRRADQLFELSDVVSSPAFRELRVRVPFLPLAAMGERRIALGVQAAAQHLRGGFVSGTFFELLGVKAHLGRTIIESDDIKGAPPVGVLTYEYWKGALGADSSIIGRSVQVNSAPITVIGVAASDFRGLHIGSVPAIWIPIRVFPVVAPSSMRDLDLDSPGWGWLRVVGRLSPGNTLPQVHQVLTAAMVVITPEFKREEVELGTTPRPAQAASLASGTRSAVVTFVAILTGVVVLVLLTACANIAGLLLARAAHREREIAVRVALGAGRGRLLRQLMTEALVLAIAGGLAGVGVFLLARAVFSGITFPGGITGSSLPLALDGRLVLFLSAITLATGVLVGLAPAYQGSRPDTVSALKGSASRRGSRQHRLRGALVTAQVAVGIVLLVGTGLFARALSRALTVNLGFSTEHLATMTVDPGLAQFDPARANAYYTNVLQRAASVPGVTAATWTSAAPLVSDYNREVAKIEGYTPAPNEKARVEFSAAGTRYHEIMGIGLISGRGFEDRDGSGERVMIVNETLAKRYFAGRSPLGAYITMSGGPWRIIGVVRDSKYHTLNEDPFPYAYFPLLQFVRTRVGSPKLVVQTAGDAGSLLPSVLAAVRAVDPNVPVFDETTMEDRLRSTVAPQLAGAWLLGVFSVLALVVAAVGIYGIVAYAVSRRTRELGIRMALGAEGAEVVRTVVAANVGFVALGIPIGLLLAVPLARAMTGFLYGVDAMDAPTLIGTSLLMLIIGLVASYIPARRIARIDPLIALRSDA